MSRKKTIHKTKEETIVVDDCDWCGQEVELKDREKIVLNPTPQPIDFRELFLEFTSKNFRRLELESEVATRDPSVWVKEMIQSRRMRYEKVSLQKVAKMIDEIGERASAGMDYENEMRVCEHCADSIFEVKQ